MRKFRYLLFVLLLLAALGIGYWALSRLVLTEPTEQPPEPVPEEEVQLYYADRYSPTLAVETRTLPETETRSERIKQIVTELGRSPDDAELISVVPEELELHSVFFDEPFVVVDFNNRLIGAASGAGGEKILLYSLVNSLLGNLPERYMFVQFLIDGEMRKTIGAYGEESGHIAIEYPLGPRWELVN